MYEYQRLTQNIQLGFYTSNYGTRYELSKMPKMEILLANFEGWRRQLGRRHLAAEGNFLQKTIGQVRKNLIIEAIYGPNGVVSIRSETPFTLGDLPF